ncbi:unnamed protein product [Adineta steineri]|uniref:Uncharacterized protein n=1 Tax=Adineta steineri TaxID=433720 RepID=A0A819WA20_9BILA|nr:unnamed protein product [Adineta steineri]CAF4122631.1 unnamed protein product [Adineta steineri]
MILFSILIIINIRQSRHRIEAISKAGNTLIQSLIFTLFNTDYAVYVTYDFATSSQIKSPDRQAVEGFIYGFTIHLCYIFASFPFATYTLASSIFHKECMSIIRRLYTNVLH